LKKQPLGTFLLCWYGGGIAILQIDPKKPPVDVLMPDIRADTADAEKRLRQFLQENISQLLDIIRSYVVRT
jgi:hypothetical protein